MDSILFKDEKIENLLSSMRKLATFLKAEGFTLIEAGKTTVGRGCTVSGTVNRCHFSRGQENVFITANKAERHG
jgi:hypothetical protein